MEWIDLPHLESEFTLKEYIYLYFTPSSSSSFDWLSVLRHSVGGDGRAAGVRVGVGAMTIDYAHEYLGVLTPSVLTPTTLRARHALIMAAVHNKGRFSRIIEYQFVFL